MIGAVQSAVGQLWGRMWRGVRRASDPFGVGRGPLSPANGIRAGIIFLVPFLLALPGDNIDGATNVGIAGLLVTLTDVGGPRRLRMTLMAISTVWVTVAVVLGVVVGVEPLWLQVMLLVVLVAGVTTWSSVGAIGTTAALAATLAAISGLAYQDETVAWITGAQYALGGAWAIAVAIALPWVTPEESALTRTQVALSHVADHLDVVRGAGRATTSASAAAAHQALTKARAAIAALSANRGSTIASSRMLLLVREASKTLEETAAAAEKAAGSEDAAETRRTDALLGASAGVLRAVGLAVADEGEHVDVARLHEAIAELPHTRDGAVEGAIARRVAATAEEGFVWDAVLLPMRGTPRGGSVGGSPVAREVRRGALARALFSPHSVVFRYAVRLGVAVAIAYGLGVAISPDYGQLAAVGALPVLQPNVGGTLREALKHSLSVVILIAVASGIVTIVDDPNTLAAIATVLVIGVFALERMSFGAFVVLLAPLAVIIAAVVDPEHHAAVLAEVGFALLGAAVAIVVGYLVFPRWERRALPVQIAAALATARGYLGAALDPAAPDDAVARARVQAEIGRINASAALMRALADSHTHIDDPEPVETMLASDAELIDAVAVLRAADTDPTEIRDWADAGLAGLEDAVARDDVAAPLPPRPSSAARSDAAAAIARAVEGIDDAMRRGQPVTTR